MTEIVTYVEMTARDQLAPAAPVPGLALDPLEPDSPLIADLHAGVGTPYGWTSASRTREEWAAGFPARTVWMLLKRGPVAAKPAMAALEQRPGVLGGVEPGACVSPAAQETGFA